MNDGLQSGLASPDLFALPPATGALLVGAGTPAGWAPLTVGATGTVLRSDGSNPSWSQVNLSTDTIGLLAIGNGGTGSGTWNGAAFTVPYTDVFNSVVLGVAPNTAATRRFLSMTGTGAAGAAPAWNPLATTDMPAGVPTAVVTQAQMEAATDNAAYVSALAMKWSPGVAKAFLRWDTSTGTPTSQQSLNVSSLTDNGVGDVTVNFTTAFSSATAYTWHYSGSSLTNDCRWGWNGATAPAAGSFRMQTVNTSQAATDGKYQSLVFFGDFA